MQKFQKPAKRPELKELTYSHNQASRIYISVFYAKLQGHQNCQVYPPYITFSYFIHFRAKCLPEEYL